MKTTLSLLLLLWSFVTPSSAKVIDFEIGTIYDAGQDGEGAIWLGANRFGSLIRYSGEIHETLTLPELGPRAEIITFKNHPNGALIGFWKTAPDEFALTSHRGKESKILAKGKGRPGEFHHRIPFAIDKEGRLWFSGADDTIRYFDPSTNQLKDVYKGMGGTQFYEGNPKFDKLNQLYLVLDSSGKVWAYTAGFINHKFITSLISLENPEAPRLVHLTHLKDPKFKSVVLFQGKFLLNLSGEDHFYLFDPQSLTLEAIASPEPGLFKASGPLQTFNGEVYFTHWSQKGTSLWHFSQSKKATQISSSVGSRDLTFIPSTSDPKSFFLIGERFQYLSPQKKRDLTLDWRNDFPFYTPTHLFPLKKQGEYFALCNTEVYIGPIPPTSSKKPATPSRINLLPAYTQWQQGLKGDIWAIDNSNAEAPILKHWNGSAWSDEPLKNLTPPPFRYKVTPDTHGRVWLRHQSKDAKTAIYYPAEERWESYPTFRDAIQATRSIPYTPLAPDIHLRLQYLPVYSAKGEIAYLTDYQEIHYFDGSQWKSWEKKKIGKDSIACAPFFDEAGDLCFGLGKQGYKLDANGTWNPAPFKVPSLPNSEKPFPEGILDRNPRRHHFDLQGNLWFSDIHTLYRVKGNRYAPVFKKGEPNPILPYSYVRSISEDRNGNLFLQLDDTQCYFISPVSPPPKTTLLLKPSKKPDRVEITLNVASKVRCTVRWKLDDGAWRTANPGDTIALGPLLSGKHRITAEAEDEFLTAETTPAYLDFEIKIDPEKQLTQLLNALEGTSEKERIGAVEALATMPERALPALEAKLADASSNTRWWVNLAIQKCEEAKRRKTAP